MNNLNQLLSSTNNITASNKSEYLRNLAKSEIEKRYSDLNTKLSVASGIENVGGLVLTAPQTISTGIKSSKSLYQSAKSLMNKPTETTTEVEPETDTAMTREPIREGSSVTYRNPRNPISDNTNLEVDTSGYENSVVQRGNLNNVNNKQLHNVVGEQNNNQGHVVNETSTTREPAKVSDIGSTSEDILPEISEGLDVGAMSEGFLNPLLDIGSIIGGIGMVVGGLVSKAHQEKRQEEEQEQLSSVNTSSKYNVQPNESNVAPVNTNQNRIQQSSTPSF